MWNPMVIATLWWLNVLGLNIQNSTTKNKIWNIFLLVGLLTSTILVLLAWENDFDIIVEIMDEFLPFFEAIIKRLLFAVKQQKIIAIFDIIKYLNEQRDIQEHRLTKRFLYLTTKALIIMRIVFTSAVCLMLLRAVFSSEKEMPYRILLPSDWHTSDGWTIMHISYFWIQLFFAFVLILSIAAVDSLYITFVAHLVCHIIINNDEFRNMFQDGHTQKRKMIDIVHRQNLIFTCLNKLNDIFSVQLLGQLLTIVVTICMGLVIINEKGLTTITTFIQLFMISSSVVQAFIYCIFGNIIAEALYNTRFSIYSSEWYSYPKEAKNVITLLQRANVENAFTFGGLLNLDLETFALIMKNSFSFYALLKASKPAEI